MNQSKLISRLMRHASKMELLNLKTNEAQSFLGYLQPLRYKNKMYLGQVATALGYDNSGKLLLLTPPEFDASKADGYEFVIHFDGNRYSCDRHEIEYLDGKPFYAWSIVTRV